MESFIPEVKTYLLQLQNTICSALELCDRDAKFLTDHWERPLGGGGITNVIENGAIFAKGGVNFSHVFGSSLPKAATATRPELKDVPFHALGVSLVIHPRNPYIPTTHANVRFFYAKDKNDKPIWWFGGGFDLTPYYGFEEDCIHWHSIAKKACDPFGTSLYTQLKKNCDDYFYLPHRQETRGIGGLFFDDWNEGGFDKSFGLMQSIGNHFLEAYLPIVEKRKTTSFGAQELAFQRYRRGRYVEFNLVYDRGTLFGLQSGGRTESILMSLPPEVEWHYNWQPEPLSQEAKLYEDFLRPRDWINLS